MQKKQQIAPAGPLRGAFAAPGSPQLPWTLPRRQAIRQAPTAGSVSYFFCSSCRFPLRFTHFCKFVSESFNKNWIHNILYINYAKCQPFSEQNEVFYKSLSVYLWIIVHAYKSLRKTKKEEFGITPNSSRAVIKWFVEFVSNGQVGKSCNIRNRCL